MAGNNREVMAVEIRAELLHSKNYRETLLLHYGVILFGLAQRMADIRKGMLGVTKTLNEDVTKANYTWIGVHFRCGRRVKMVQNPLSR